MYVPFFRAPPGRQVFTFSATKIYLAMKSAHVVGSCLLVVSSLALGQPLVPRPAPYKGLPQEGNWTATTNQWSMDEDNRDIRIIAPPPRLHTKGNAAQDQTRQPHKMVASGWLAIPSPRRLARFVDNL
jgi:hypothetical protein